jgi:hypothetical protein
MKDKRKDSRAIMKHEIRTQMATLFGAAIPGFQSGLGHFLVYR